MHLAAVATLSEVDPLPWVHKFTVAVDVAHRVEWMNQVAWMLKELPVEAVPMATVDAAILARPTR